MGVDVYSNVVVGAHKSDSARAAVEQATQLARTTGAHLHLVTSIAKDAGPDSAERMDAERSLEAMLVGVGNVPCTTHVIPGDVAKGIVSVAEDVGADLIVVGNKRMQGAGRVLGSVPNDVAHSAPCAVLIAKTT